MAVRATSSRWYFDQLIGCRRGQRQHPSHHAGMVVEVIVPGEIVSSVVRHRYKPGFCCKVKGGRSSGGVETQEGG